MWCHFWMIFVVWIWANKKEFGPKEKLINHDATI
jgi:hypothetical protein